ncbi:hypothetical protein EMIT0P43_80101 [Pseudomonas jessenii]
MQRLYVALYELGNIVFHNFLNARRSPPVGAGLLAKTASQLASWRLTHRYREQARSHRVQWCFEDVKKPRRLRAGACVQPLKLSARRDRRYAHPR